MLRLLLGTDWISNREKVLNEIAGDIKNRRPGQILLVPELISHETERLLCATAGDTASRYAEVLSFPQLLRRFTDDEAMVPKECMDKGGRLTAMAAVTKALSGQLKSYASVSTNPEFLTALVDAVDEFKRCCIGPVDLKEAASQTEGTLAQKLEELSLVLGTYDSICSSGLMDPRDQMNWLLDELECTDFARKHSFYVDGFPDLTRQHMALVEHMICNSPMVTVSLCCDQPSSEHAAYEKAGQTASEFIRIAKRHEVPIEIIHVQERNDQLAPLRHCVLEGKIESSAVLKGCVTPIRCDSIFDECLVAAERVMELVRQGSRYRDIGIVSTDIDHYRGILSLVFRRCGIPVYLSGTDDILEKTVIATVLSALDAAMSDLDQQDVLRYLKSVLSPLTPEACDKLENYAITWGIRGQKWNQEWKNHPDGLKKQWDDESTQALAELNEARAIGVLPLITLRKNLFASNTVSGKVDALREFLEEIQLAENLEALAEEAEAQGDARSAQEYNQLWDILLGAMDQLSNALAKTDWDAENFSRLFRLLLSQYDVGTIPTVLDSVTVGPMEAMRCQQVKHMMVLGAVEGQLPSYGGSTGVLTDQERTELRNLGVPLTGGGMEGVAAEFASIYGVFCGATDTIYVSCPADQPSYIFQRICSMVDINDGKHRTPGPGPGMSSRWEAGAYLARWDAEDQAATLGVTESYLEVRNRATYTTGKLSRQQARKLYGKKLKLSASQIDAQAECKMAYFLRYGLQAAERKEARVDSAEFGNFVHSVLEQAAREIQNAGGFASISKEQAMAIARKYSKEYAKAAYDQLDSDRLAYLFHRNELELDAVMKELWSEMSQSEFKPVEFELRFGAEGHMPAVTIDGSTATAELRGFVDRVDNWNHDGANYFRVVDYKTGRKDFDYCDVANGVGLQMLLYLFALEQQGNQLLGDHRISAGIQYFPARMPYLNEDGRLTEEEAEAARSKDLKRKGLILNDESVVQAMEPGDELKRLNCKRKTDGSLSGDVADRQQFSKLKSYVMNQLEDMVDSIASGEIAPNPYTRGTSHDACTYCPYGAICAREREKGRRNYKAMTSKQFWDEVEKEKK